jgi:hypothetical protein
LFFDNLVDAASSDFLSKDKNGLATQSRGAPDGWLNTIRRAQKPKPHGNGLGFTSKQVVILVEKVKAIKEKTLGEH